MLKCSTFGCFEKPIKQCLICNRLFLCRKCVQVHLNDNLENESACAFDTISLKLSKSHHTALINSIIEKISLIEKHKREILNEAFIITTKVENIKNLAINQLNDMIKEYYTLLDKKAFGEKYIKKVQEIIYTDLVFEALT